MSLELGGRSKSIQYLNLTKSGMESSNDISVTETCNVSIKFANKPLLEDQSQYLCAVTRFSVPLVEVPTIDATGFDVYRYTETDEKTWADAHPELPADTKLARDLRKDAFYTYWETLTPEPTGGAPGNNRVTVDLPAAYSFHQFMQNIEARLDSLTIPSNYHTLHGGSARQAADTLLMVTSGNAPASLLVNRASTLAERIKMTLTADMRFRVMLTDDIHTDHIYIKMKPGMFRMLQFQTTPLAKLGTSSYITSHSGFRLHAFHPEGDGALTVQDKVDAEGVQLSALHSASNQRGVQAGSPDHVQVAYDGVYNPQRTSGDALRFKARYVIHTAQMSCADATRIREIVFTSDLSVKSEGNAEASYKRFLCDYQVFNKTEFSYNIKDVLGQDPYNPDDPLVAKTSTVSDRIYTSNNASAGRWQELIEPSPMWEVEVSATLRCWDYENQRYHFVQIPLPAGMQYSVKLIFVSKENHVVSVAEKPDKYHA